LGAPDRTPLVAKATHQQTRALNQGLVLRTLYHHGPASRAEVARLTGLTRTTVSDVVGEFLAEGLAREIGRGPSTGGKAPILVEVDDDARLAIGLDLGERAFTGALVNLRGVVRRLIEVPVESRDGQGALATVYQLIDSLLAGTSSASILGIGVGTPGIVDTERGIIRWAVNLDWQDLPLGHLVFERTGLPTYLANDARAAAIGEYLFANPDRSPNLVAIKIGLGVGAGIILNGQLFQGDGFGAGEIGHTGVVDDGVRCRCGRFGCLETVVSSRALLREAEAAARAHPGSALDRIVRATGMITLGDLATAASEGDEPARRVVVAAGRALGRAIAGVIGLLNVRRIVLLGTVAALGDEFVEAVRDEAARRSLETLAAQTEIELGRPNDDVVLLGAVALLMTRELGLVPVR
jgi:predicted NBD/HSP70 family sugar kinase